MSTIALILLHLEAGLEPGSVVWWVRAVKLKVEGAQCFQLFLEERTYPFFLIFWKENQQDLGDGGSWKV